VFSLLPEVPKHYHLSDGLAPREPQDSRSAATIASKLLKPELLLSIVCFQQLQERKVDIKYRRIAPFRFRPSNDLLPRSPSISPPRAPSSALIMLPSLKPCKVTSIHKPCHCAEKRSPRRLMSSTSYRSLPATRFVFVFPIVMCDLTKTTCKRETWLD
jgi:hypothetical protein